jgi:hypothetical protein
MDTADRTSTKNLQRHAECCWGGETIQKAREVKDLATAKEEVMNARRLQSDGSITAMFSRAEGKGKITYSHRQHTHTETRYFLHLFSFVPQMMSL